MKKTKWAVALLVLMLVVGLASLLVGCGAEKETATTVSPNTTVAGPVTTVAPTTTSAPAPPTTADDGKPIELKFSYPTSTRASLYEAYLLPWANSITAATNNRVTITHYPDNALVKEEQQYDALLSGTADMGLIEMEFTPGVKSLLCRCCSPTQKWLRGCSGTSSSNTARMNSKTCRC
jgi:TRAP-type C4-dicarboxylate transport system substrate-binding protein